MRSDPRGRYERARGGHIKIGRTGGCYPPYSHRVRAHTENTPVTVGIRGGRNIHCHARTRGEGDHTAVQGAHPHRVPITIPVYGRCGLGGCRHYHPGSV